MKLSPAVTLVLLLPLALASSPLLSQSAAPATPTPEGINDRFLDESVDPNVFVGMFEAEGREIYAQRHAIVDALQLEPGHDVADIGAGTGFFSRLIAERVGPEGTVFAVDISQNLLDHIEEQSREAGITNVRTVLGEDRSTQLEEGSIDVAFVCDTYHHFSEPYAMLASIRSALRPGGVLVIVDFERVQGLSSDFALSHVRAGKGVVSDEVRDSGFDFLEEVPLMEDQYVLRFRRRN